MAPPRKNLNFNPRFHERSDHAQFFSKFLYLLYFNPRFHERSDYDLYGKIETVQDFNPRFHERSD